MSLPTVRVIPKTPTIFYQEVKIAAVAKFYADAFEARDDQTQPPELSDFFIDTNRGIIVFKLYTYPKT